MLSVAAAQTTSLKARLFRGFAGRPRRSIVGALQTELLTVTEIIEATGLSQSNASNHPACLVSDGRVVTLLQMAHELLANVAKGVYERTRYTVPQLEGSEAYS